MTNPNPVAPKTDTPATQLEPPIVEALAEAEMRMCLCSQCVESVANYLRLAKCPVAAKMVTTLESTLAAERASRLQADTEQFNAGIAKALATCCEQYDAKRAEFEYNIGVHACENAVRRLSKPSVSPEQAEETK